MSVPRLLRALNLAAVALAAALWLPSAGLAQTGNLVADAFLRTLTAGGYDTAVVGNVDAGDGRTVLDGIVAASDDGRRTLNIASVRLDEPAITGNNVLRAETIVYDTVSLVAAPDEPPSTLKRVHLSDVRFPLGEADDLTFLDSFSTLTAEDVAIVDPRGGRISVAAVTVGLSQGERFSGARVAFDDLTVGEGVTSETFTEQLAALGLDALTLSFNAAGRWDPDGGAVQVDDVTLTFDGIGALSIDGAVDGLTREVIARLTAPQSTLAGVIPAAAGIEVKRLRLAYRDDGLIGRLVDEASTGRAGGRAAVADELAQALGAQLAPLGDPDLTAATVAAVRRFLSETGTLAITVEPAAAVDVSRAFSAALVDPEGLARLLNLSVSADP